jgi:hypothetical protein
VSRRRVGIAAAAAAAAAVGAYATASSGTVVSVSVRPLFTVTAPSGLDVGTLRVKESASGAIAVSVRANFAAGYRLTVSRTPLSVADSPIALKIQNAPSGTTLDISPGSGVPIPASGSLSVGRRTAGITPAAGDAWTGRLVVGSIAAGKPGTRTARVTFTAQAAARPAISARVVVSLDVGNGKGR